MPDTPRSGSVSAPLVSADAAADRLAGRRLIVLTGAGLSTDSGIPDYRGPDSPPRSPMTYDEFVSGPRAQRRYWARSHVGWQRLGSARPNDGHRALAALESAGVVRTLITQNVDGLHRAAGSRAVIDLHGRIDQVICLHCGDRTGRLDLHHRLDAANPDFAEHADVRTAPDGDVELEDTSGFRLVACLRCGGTLKPDVVFFGENVPKSRVDEVYAAMDAGGALLVAGSSLTVMSGLRFVRHAAKLGWPIVIVNRGITRGDPLATGRVHAGCTETLTALADRWGG
ncbi:NAD-dependent protein deacetylase [Nakamurella sp.]|uniref:NAD-dependent protein deacetylase n=1 Tax=Nakamurella sp. TaxID=1869182 RepID=UPI0037849CF0